MAKMVLKYRFRKVVDVVPGGRLRQDSVQSGLRLISDGIVAIHDGVRPFITKALLQKGIKLCRRYKAVVFGLPVSETIKKVNGHRVIKTVARGDLYAIQTPQFFDVKLLKMAYKKSGIQHREFTDDAAVVENAGHPVYIFEGLIQNIKITYRKQLQRIDKI